MGAFYQQSKTLEALMKYKPASDFILKSRTNPDAFMHHGGTLPCLWGLFGPPRVAKKAKKFVKKVENGSFAECKDCLDLPSRNSPPRRTSSPRKSHPWRKAEVIPRANTRSKRRRVSSVALQLFRLLISRTDR